MTQLSVGAFTWGVFLERFVGSGSAEAVRPVQAVMALLFGLLALAASVLHLGRPQYAFRAILGLRHSWLSREIIAFGLFAALACAYAGAVVAPVGWVPLSMITMLAWSVAAVGAVAVSCSVMIYASLRREFWSFPRTSVRFGLTTIVLGLATLWLSLALSSAVRPSEPGSAMLAAASPAICWGLLVASGTKLAWEAALFRHLLSWAMTPLKRSALLMLRDLASPVTARFALGILGGVFAPALLLRQCSAGSLDDGGLALTVSTAFLFGASLAGELLERYLFFAAVATPRMPGGVR